MNGEVEWLNAMIATQQAIAAADHDLRAVMQLAVDRAAALTGAAGAGILFLEGDGLVVRAATQAKSVGLVLPLGGSMTAACVETGEMQVCEDVDSDERADRDSALRIGIRSFVSVPLLHEGNVVGVLDVVAVEPHSFGTDDIRALELLGGLVGSALTHALDYEENRRLLEERTVALNGLREMQQEIINQERLRALGQMASAMAHELNNALQPIISFSDLLREIDPVAESRSVNSYAHIIHVAAEDAANAVGRIRNFYQERQEDTVLAPTDLRRMVADVVALTQPKWHDEPHLRGIAIHVETDLEDVPEIMADGAALREAVANLLLNAVSALKHGGTITVHTHQEGDSVFLEVRDTGVGMTEDVLKQAPRPFFTTKETEGSGLGLWVVRDIVDRHGGKLSIASQPGKGTRVRIALPIRAVNSVDDDLQRTFSWPRGLRLLAVDDDVGILESLVQLGAVDGNVVHTATDSAQAMNAILSGTFDLVLIDRAMPDMSGDELAMAVKSMAPETPVIMLTGFGSVPGEALPQVDVLVNKPASLAQLRRAFVVALTGSGRRATVEEEVI